MRLSIALILFTHVIALMGFLSLLSAGILGNISSLVFFIAIIFSLYNDYYEGRYYLNQRVSTLLSIFLLVFVLIRVVFLKGELFDGVLIFLVYTQIIKLLGEKKVRDMVQIYILSFFQFLACSVITINATYGAAFILYVVVSVWAIMVLNFKNESNEAFSNEDPKIISPKFLSITALVGLCILSFTALLFITIPRVKTGFFMSNLVEPNILKSGFSDEVRLGQVGEILLDSATVFRIRMINENLSELPRPIYWRGIALDDFDGVRWRASYIDSKTIYNDEEGFTNGERTSSNLVAHEIITEPIDTDIVFAASQPVGFKGLVGRRITVVNDSYVLNVKSSLRYKYLAFSNLETPSVDELKNDVEGYPQEVKDAFTKLPAVSQEIYDLAKKIAANETNAYDKAKAIQRYLQENMRYTRILERGEAEFPLDDFLFENKAGHCEYFATAMAVLLRVEGIPSRIVNGFLEGEWNEHGSFFTVRKSDAHSWVEVYFPRYGWIKFDPTTETNITNAERHPHHFVLSYIDYLRFRWTRYIVDFSRRDQLELFKDLNAEFQWHKTKFYKGSMDKIISRWKLLIGIMVFSYVLSILFKNRILAIPFRNRDVKRNTRANKIYNKTLSLLSKHGFRKPDYLTHREFANEVFIMGGDKYNTFKTITEAYIEMRFGLETSLERIDYLDKLYSTLKREII